MKRPEELGKIPDLYYKALNYVFENNMVPSNGMWLEFGVYAGGSLNRIARYADGAIVYGFDSFEGLPEAWKGRVEPWDKSGSGATYGAGTFSLGGVLPSVLGNVSLVKGWYKDSLPVFLREHFRQVSFIHVDSDIYSSAKDIFNNLKDRICNGCVIVFDELVGYQGFEEHEWKAWWEFVEENSITFEWIGGNSSGTIVFKNDGRPLFDRDRPPTENVSPSQENVAVRIINNPSFKA
jgi:hypothetical protein